MHVSACVALSSFLSQDLSLITSSRLSSPQTVSVSSGLSLSLFLALSFSPSLSSTKHAWTLAARYNPTNNIQPRTLHNANRPEFPIPTARLLGPLSYGPQCSQPPAVIVCSTRPALAQGLSSRGEQYRIGGCITHGTNQNRPPLCL